MLLSFLPGSRPDALDKTFFNEKNIKNNLYAIFSNYIGTVEPNRTI